MSLENISGLLSTQRVFFSKGATRELDFRKDQLRLLLKAVQENETAIAAALKKDLGKSEAESFLGEIRPSRTDAAGRLDLARKAFGRKTFSRKDYLSIFTTLSTASASRDLKRGTDERILLRSGDKAKARYRFRS